MEIPVDETRPIRIEQLQAEIAALNLPGYVHAVLHSRPGVTLAVLVEAGVLSEAQAKALRDVIAAHVPVAPEADAELATIASILDKDDAGVTAGELKSVALKALRRMRRRGALT